MLKRKPLQKLSNKIQLPISSNSVKKDISDYVDHSSIDEKREKWQPNDAYTIIANIRKMRSVTVAPVDTMGCHKCSDDNADEKVTLVSMTCIT